MPSFEAWLNSISLPALGVILLVSFAAAAVGGHLLRRLLEARNRPVTDPHEGYVISAVLGLLALLLGFTFALAVDRFETRRLLVLEEANAIGTTWLRTQLMPEPHRARISDVLQRYVDNRIALAHAHPGDPAQRALLATNDRLLGEFWDDVEAAFPSIDGTSLAIAYLNSANQMIDLDASRKAARLAKVPSVVFTVLFVYIVVTAAELGYVSTGLRGRLATGVFLSLLTLALLLIIDLDRPTLGSVREAQGPMERLAASLRATPGAGLSAAATAPPP